jgi:plasmid stabilization system protein ParE
MDEHPFWFHPDAYAEVLSSHDRYAEVTIELAERFQDELERSRQAIARNPLIWPSYSYGTQRYLMKTFPYFIVFRVTKNRIEIIAVAHERQRPGYWTQRTVS